MPADRPFNFKDKPSDRTAFADLYMERLTERGIEVIALADHHTAEWLDVMRAAGERAGIAVFPGVEVTTASGADGVHLVIIGDRDAAVADIEDLLIRVCGFGGADHPRYNPISGDPAPAPRQLADILDGLDDKWFALAPHALGENGIASGKTLKGTLKWNALHHPRLAALDPGVGSERTQRSDGKIPHNELFRSRTLDEFPRLRDIAYIHTSDGYSLDAIGTRYSWIRMAEPTLEALRQASLDHQARIIGYADHGLPANYNPNQVQHPWIESVSIQGKIGNSAAPVAISLDPRLNVIIGGRGAGKSTIVSAIRHLYGSNEGLPESVRADAERFSHQVLRDATIEGTHRLPVSQERQQAMWNAEQAAVTHRGSALLPTTFPVRVFNQKELFERTANRTDDPQSASRYLLELVDEELGLTDETDGIPTSWRSRLRRAEHEASAVVISLRETYAVRARVPELQATLKELEEQVAAFGDPDTQKARQRNELVVKQNRALALRTAALTDAVDTLPEVVNRVLTSVSPAPRYVDEDGTLDGHHLVLESITDALREAVAQAAASAGAALRAASAEQRSGPWAQLTTDAEAQVIDFQQRLDALGVDPAGYLHLRDRRDSTEQALITAKKRLDQIPELERAVEKAWNTVDALHAERRSLRQTLLHNVEERAEKLTFQVDPHRNTHSWIRAARSLLNLRNDTFSDEVRALGQWLWEGPEQDLPSRLRTWRECLLANEYRTVEAASGCRPGWWKKLQGVDEIVRIRLASLLADDTATMYFLKTGGDPAESHSWQQVTNGSAGQRSAAMLSFVLNYGTEPLVLDQPEDDLDTALITKLVVPQIRRSRWSRQLIIVTHHANIPVNGDAEQVIVLDNDGFSIKVKTSPDPDNLEVEALHAGPIEVGVVREDIQEILEGGKEAFRARERRYNNDMNPLHEAKRELLARSTSLR